MQTVTLSIKSAKILIAIVISFMVLNKNNLVFAQETIDVGETGWKVKRPVMAAACEAITFVSLPG